MNGSIDKLKAQRMLFKIIGVERENLKTKKERKIDLVEKLKKIIEEELKR